MIRVLHIGLSSNPGGVENFVLNYHRNIDRKKVQFDYLDMYGDGLAFANEFNLLGGTSYSIPNYKRHPISAAKQLSSLLKKKKFSLVHVHMQSAANIMPIIVSMRANIRVIAHCHSSSTPKGILRKILNCANLKWLRRQNVLKWACGKRAGKWMWGDSFRYVDVIPNAIDFEKYKYDQNVRDSLKNILGYNENIKVIGFVGRFGDEKNTFFLIDVLKELITIDQNYRLVTVGGNDLYEEFVDKIKSEGLEEYYYSAGIQKSAEKWYQIMDAFLLPSIFEGLPTVGVEAQAAGLPCFFSDRISREIGMIPTTRFLNIDSDSAKVWAKEIANIVENNDRKFINMSDDYKIENAARLLEEKYCEAMLVNRRK